MLPSTRTNEYLSSSNGRKNSLDPAETDCANLLFTLLTVNNFLIERDPLFNYTTET